MALSWPSIPFVQPTSHGWRSEDPKWLEVLRLRLILGLGQPILNQNAPPSSYPTGLIIQFWQWGDQWPTCPRFWLFKLSDRIQFWQWDDQWLACQDIDFGWPFDGVAAQLYSTTQLGRWKFSIKTHYQCSNRESCYWPQVKRPANAVAGCPWRYRYHSFLISL